MPSSCSLSPQKQQALGVTDTHIVYVKQGLGVHPMMFKAFEKMQRQAATDGIDLQIASGFRDFARQLAIFNGKLSGQRPVKDMHNRIVNMASLNPQQAIDAVLLYSALPGASRHHWGCDIDVFDAHALGDQALNLEAWEYQQGGPMHRLHQWLQKHAADYGFYHPYQRYQGGVAPEPWHLSYHPVAKEYQQVVDIATLTDVISQADICQRQNVLNNLSHIYQQFVCNICAFGDNSWPHG